MSKPLKEQYASTPLFGLNAASVEAMYESYLDDPDDVPAEWRSYFASLANGARDVAHGPIRERLLEQQSLQSGRPAAGSAQVAGVRGGAVADASEKQAAVSRMIQVYSLRGHQIADLDPLGLMQRHTPGVLKLDFLGLSEADMESEFFTGGLAGTGDRRMKLADILALLRRIYCGKIGAEFAHVSRSRERLWLRKRFEQGMVSNIPSAGKRRWLLEQLTAAEGIERYLHTRYVGQKRFSLEGGESLIPMLDELIQQGGRSGVRELVIGMAHRGRINVLVNVLGKSPETSV